MDIHALWGQHALVLGEWAVGRCIQDDIVLAAVLRVVLLRVVDHMVSSKRAYHGDIPRAAYRSDIGPERFGDLHREGTHTTGGAIDKHLLTSLNLACFMQSLQGGERRRWHRRRLLERHPGRL